MMMLQAATAVLRRAPALNRVALAMRKAVQRAPATLSPISQASYKKRVPIREDGELRHVSRQEAMLLTLYAKAIQGDTKASSQLLTMVTRTETQDTASSQPDVVTDNDRAIVEDFLRRNLPMKKEGES